MNNGGSLVMGVYGIYLIAVVLAGNSGPLVDAIREDGKKFAPWLLAAFVLTILAQNEQTKPVVAPFALLLFANAVLRNYGVIESQAKTILGGLTK